MEQIKFIIPKSQEGIKTLKTTIIPPHFCMIIVGKPGSGKTTFIKTILHNEMLLFKQFDYVFCLSNSVIEFEDLFLPNDNYNSNFDLEWIYSKINEIKSKEYINVLIIIDDMVSALHEYRHEQKLINLFFNRRHLLTNGMISLMITTQKFNCIPRPLRSSLSVCVIFSCDPREIEAISREIVYIDTRIFEENCFKNICDGGFVMYNSINGNMYKNFDLIYIKK